MNLKLPEALFDPLEVVILHRIPPVTDAAG
jgi:hypothetical protein